MIRNIVFDLGNVLLSFKPSEYFDRKGYTEKQKVEILSGIFNTREWLQLDNGDITIPEAIECIAERSALTKEEIARIFNLRTDIMVPIAKNVNLLPDLKKRGFRLYYLSNFPADIFDEIKSVNNFFNFFDGGIISAEVKHSKPDARIYEILLEKYSLVPEECLFIDDLRENVMAGEAAGMNILHLETHDMLEKKLNNLGLLGDK